MENKKLVFFFFLYTLSAVWATHTMGRDPYFIVTLQFYGSNFWETPSSAVELQNCSSLINSSGWAEPLLV